MNIAAVVRSDRGGLGTLSRMFDRGLGFYRRLALNRIPGERGEFCREPDERTRLVEHRITVADAHWLCEGADVVISFETWYGAIVPHVARQMRVRTVLVPMYECLSPDGQELRETDVAIAPTGLDLITACDETPGLAQARHVMVPVPCDVERIAFTQRTRAETFIHRVGHQGEGRNGTIEILNAWRFVKSPARLLVFHQGSLPCAVPSDTRIECRKTNPPEYWQQEFAAGELCLHLTRHDALSLPIQEALTAGMPVICSRWWPHCDDGERNGYLPPWCQSNAVPVSHTVQDRMCRQFTSHRVAPEAVAEVVDRVYGADVSAASREAREWAEARSWDKLRGAWLDAIA